MFTGIVEEKGKILAVKKSATSMILKIDASKIFSDLKIGDSVATNGVCLTVTSLNNKSFTVDVTNETVKKTNLINLKIGDYVNLERALCLNTRLGGHIVSGHIDGIGKIINIKQDDIAHIYTIKTKSAITKYIIKKGSIAIDGISLTVVDVDDDSFKLSVIPHTLANTILVHKKVGSTVNIENDLMAKYIEQLIFNSNKKMNENSSKIDMKFLLENGF